MLMSLAWVCLLACKPSEPTHNVDDPDHTDPTGDTASADVALASGPTLHEAPLADIVPLVHGLAVQTEAPTQLTVHLDDGERVLHIAFPEWSTLHDVPLLGVPASRTIHVTAELMPEQGVPLLVDAGRYRTPPLPEPFPDIDRLALDAARMEPGYTFGGIKSPAPRVHYLVAFDDRMEVVWWSDDGGDYGDVRVRAEDAAIVGIRGQTPAFRTFLGDELLSYVPNAKLPHEVDFELGVSHHEMYPLPDGSFWTLGSRSVEVPEFPFTYTEPSVLMGAAILDDQGAVHVGADGRTLQQIWMTDVLNTQRIGFGSLGVTSEGRDWVHLNAVVPTSDGGILVSARHQDALLRFDENLELLWILGDPIAWGPELAPFLLAPVGDVVWPYHAHGPSLAEDGTIWLFDNHSFGGLPYTPVADLSPEISRVVQLRVDPVAMTVEQLTEFTTTPAGPLYSPALGNAQVLPQTGHVLAAYGFLDGELPLSNAEEGRGYKSVRLLEFDPSRPTEPAMDVRLSSQRGQFLLGFQMYRAVRIGSLYPADVVVTHTAAVAE